MTPVRPAGAPPSLSIAQVTAQAPGGQEPAPPVATGHDQPARQLHLNARTVRLGSFKPLKTHQARQLLALALIPSGEVSEEDATTHAAPGLSLASGDRDYRYRANAASLNEDSPPASPERLQVLARVDRAGNLKHLRATSLAHPALNSADGHCLNLDFQPRTSRLETLPEELKLAINRHLDDNDNLNLRAASSRLHATANDGLSEPTRFVLEHGHVLAQAGYADYEMQGLANRPDPERRFVVRNHPALQALGYRPRDINRLATLPVDRHPLVLEHGASLQHDGYTGEQINDWAAMDEEPRQFVNEHRAIMIALGFEPRHINALARLPVQRRRSMGNLARHHGAVLKDVGYASWEISDLSLASSAHQNAVVALVRQQGEALKAGGFRGSGLDQLVELDAEQIKTVLAFALQHGQQLTRHGYGGEDITAFALLPGEAQAAILQSTARPL